LKSFKRARLITVVFLSFSLLLSVPVVAQNKVVVIPLFEEGQCECKGLLSSGGRWCNQGNGTVLDMTTCLVWLRAADWGGRWAWDGDGPDNAHTRAGLLKSGDAQGLNDDSIFGDWRLPTLTELKGLANGTEAVRTDTPRFFQGFQGIGEGRESGFWSSTSHSTADGYAEVVWLSNGIRDSERMFLAFYVWPVRSNKW
jgi:hypothetical protein